MTTTFAPIPRAEQSYDMPIPWRCWCGAEFGTYRLLAPADDPQRIACENTAKAHRATHRKFGGKP